MSDTTTRTSINQTDDHEWQLVVDLLNTKEPIRVHFILDQAAFSLNHVDLVRIPEAIAKDLIHAVKDDIKYIRKDNMPEKIKT